MRLEVAPSDIVALNAIEAEDARSHRWMRFEERLEETDPELLDLLRPAVVDHA